MVRASDLQPMGSNPGRSASCTAMGKLFIHVCLCSSSSITWYRCKLGVRGTSCATIARVPRLAASDGVWLSAIEKEISAALWALVAREGL